MTVDLSWLEALEARVHEAAARLRAASEDNDRLRRRVGELEGELAGALDRATAAEREAARALDDLAAHQAGAGTGAEQEQAWRHERDEIRGRVERLAARLGDLLADGGDPGGDEA